jgi:hypothetical protein
MLSPSHADEDIGNKRPCHIIFRDIILAVKADEALSRSSSQSTSPSMEGKPIDEEKHDPKPAKRLSILHMWDQRDTRAIADQQVLAPHHKRGYGEKARSPAFGHENLPRLARSSS